MVLLRLNGYEAQVLLFALNATLEAKGDDEVILPQERAKLEELIDRVRVQSLAAKA